MRALFHLHRLFSCAYAGGAKRVAGDAIAPADTGPPTTADATVSNDGSTSPADASAE